jgi:hypothetical protein
MFQSFASASGVPPLFDESSKYIKRHWFYTYLGRPHWAMSDRSREHHKPQNERHAAWERFPKTQNERHAPWERDLCRDGPCWSPQTSPPKTPQTVYFKLFLMFCGAPLEHPSCAHQKMEQPKWAPKRAHSGCATYLFFKRFLMILVLCLHFWHAILFRFLCKTCKKALVLYIFGTPSLRPCRTTSGDVKNPKTSPTLMRTLRRQTERAPRCMGTLLEYSRSRMVAQDGFPQSAQTIYFKRFGAFFRQHSKM